MAKRITIDDDLWLLARQSTFDKSRPSLVEQLFRFVTVSLPGAPTRTMAVSLLGRENCGIVLDLNKYRAGYDLAPYVDAGIDKFILRMGGPTRWVSGNYAYQIDASFKPYMDQLDYLGMLDNTYGYIVHNTFEPSAHVPLIQQWTSGGYMPAALWVDHEVAQQWVNGVLVTQSPLALVTSLQDVSAAIETAFGKKTGVYTARWFINSYGYSQHVSYFNNVNANSKERPLWEAWYPQTFGSFTNLEDVLNVLINPTQSQIDTYLKIGTTEADLWQFTDRIKLGSDTTGLDCSITINSLSDFTSLMTPQAPGDTTVEDDIRSVIDTLNGVNQTLQLVLDKLGG